MDSKKIEDKIGNGREYRRAQSFECRAPDNEEDRKTVQGYATTYNEEYMLYDFGDVVIFEQVDSRAFDNCDMSDVIFQYNHEGRVFARKSNGTLRLNSDEHGLHIEADLGGTQIGRELYDEIAGGYTTKMSFGFRVDEDKREIVEDIQNNKTFVHRTITKIGKLYDCSAVSIPANDGTEISARSFCDGVVAELHRESEEKRDRENKLNLLKLLLEV